MKILNKWEMLKRAEVSMQEKLINQNLFLFGGKNEMNNSDVMGGFRLRALRRREMCWCMETEDGSQIYTMPSRTKIIW